MWHKNRFNNVTTENDLINQYNDELDQEDAENQKNLEEQEETENQENPPINFPPTNWIFIHKI